MSIVYDAFRLMLVAGLAYVMLWVVAWILFIAIVLMDSVTHEDRGSGT